MGLSRYLYTYIHSSVTHNSKKVEMTKLCPLTVTKQNVTFHSWITQTYIDTCDNMHEPRKCYGK